MNRYLVQITDYHGEYIDADYFREDINGYICFYVRTFEKDMPSVPITKCIAKYNLEKIYGWREMNR